MNWKEVSVLTEGVCVEAIAGSSTTWDQVLLLKILRRPGNMLKKSPGMPKQFPRIS